MKMEWISVKDHLPDGFGIYWVCYEINGKLKTHHCIWEEKYRLYKGKKWGWRSSTKRSNIKYWMPLPLPPKEDKSFDANMYQHVQKTCVQNSCL